MPRRPGVLTQADVARAVRAAKQAGAAAVEIKPDGSILVQLSPQSRQPNGHAAGGFDDERIVAL